MVVMMAIVTALLQSCISTLTKTRSISIVKEYRLVKKKIKMDITELFVPAITPTDRISKVTTHMIIPNIVILPVIADGLLGCRPSAVGSP